MINFSTLMGYTPSSNPLSDSYIMDNTITSTITTNTTFTFNGVEIVVPYGMTIKIENNKVIIEHKYTHTYSGNSCTNVYNTENGMPVSV